MGNYLSEIESLRIENEMLRLQLKVAENNSLCLLKASSSDLANKITLVKTIKLQQDLLTKIVFNNAGNLGVNEYAKNVYHLIYQN
jgi:hypothetical protein